MSFKFRAKVGDTIELSAQLWDQDESMPKRVFCELRKPDGTLLEARFELTYQSLGRFVATRVMQDEPQYSALYYIYESDGTTPDFTYGVGEDVFVKNIEGQLIVDNLDAKVSTAGGGSDALEGTVEECSELEGALEEEEALQGELADETILEGVVTDEC